MEKVRSINRKEFAMIRKDIDRQINRSVNYMRKVNNDRIICTAEYYMLTADDYLIIYIIDNYTQSVDETQHIKFKKLLMDNMPDSFTLEGDLTLKVQVITSLSVHNNEWLFHTLSNAFKIIIPTSLGHGFNIIDRSNKSYERLIQYMDETAVWWLREDDGPPVVTDEDDCYIFEYIARISKYI